MTPLFAITSRTPRSKSGGVVSDFAVRISCRPVSGSVEKTTRSVNVPPTSVATRREPIAALSYQNPARKDRAPPAVNSGTVRPDRHACLRAAASGAPDPGAGPAHERPPLRLVAETEELGPITPELVLVDPELARAARAALPEPGAPARRETETTAAEPIQLPGTVRTQAPGGDGPRRLQLDTPDGRLRRHGISLERRVRRSGISWRLVLVRGEVVEAAGLPGAGAPPEELTSLLAGVVGDRPLQPVPWFWDDPDFARLQAYVAEQRDALLAHDPGVRLGTDPENLHQHRVAGRRLRAALRTGRKLVDPAWAEPIRTELSRLGRITGPLRDLDVLLDWLERERRRLPAADRTAVAALAQELEGERGTLRDESASRARRARVPRAARLAGATGRGSREPVEAHPPRPGEPRPPTTRCRCPHGGPPAERGQAPRPPAGGESGSATPSSSRAHRGTATRSASPRPHGSSRICSATTRTRSPPRTCSAPTPSARASRCSASRPVC